VIDTLGYSYRLLFVDIRRRKIHTCTNCKMADGSREWFIVD